MNLQQVAEGLQSILQKFPQLVEETSYEGSKNSIENVLFVLESFGYDVSISQSNANKNTAPQKRKKVVSPSHQIAPALRNSNGANKQSSEIQNNRSFPKILCQYIANALVGSFSPPRKYQYDLTVHILHTFRTFIPSLLSLYGLKSAYQPLLSQNSKSPFSNETKEAFLSTIESLTTIAKLEPQCLNHVFTILSKLPISFAELQTYNDTTRFSKTIFQLVTIHPNASRILSSYWPWSPLKNLLTSPSEITRYFSSMALSAFNYLSEADRLQFVQKITAHKEPLQNNNNTSSEYQLTTEHQQAIEYEKIDMFSSLSRAWYWTTLVSNAAKTMHAKLIQGAAITTDEESNQNSYVKTLSNWQDAMCLHLMKYFETQSEDSFSSENSSSTNDSTTLFGLTSSNQANYVDVNGVSIPIRNNTHPTSTPNVKSPYVYVESSNSSVKSLAMALNESRPILLEGPAGSGKSLLVNHMAHLTQNQDYLRIYIDDQMDSKTLLGTQTCTDIPGEFVWRPGALAQAMTQGRWVVLEDVHRAQFEVLAALIPLFEKNVLLIPGRAEVLTAAPGFRLIATWTTGSSSITTTFVSDYLKNQTTTNNKSPELSSNTNVVAALPPSIKTVPGAALSQLSQMASTATAQAHVLLHRLFTRILVPSFTLNDIRSIILARFPLLRQVHGLANVVIETTRCFAAPSTMSDQLLNTYIIVSEEDPEAEELFKGETEDTDMNSQAEEVIVPKFAHNANSPFGPACAVSLRHLTRFAERVERIISLAPLTKIEPRSIDRNFPDMNTLQVQLSSDLALMIVRSALDCFTAAAPPTHSTHVLDKRRGIIACASALWQVQKSDIEK